MNIFYTNECPIISAAEHCHKHRIKMILEYAQMLSTSHHVLGGEVPELAYKKTHQNHPSSVWCRSSAANYEWVWLCAKELCELYTKHSGKTHKTEAVIDQLVFAPSSISATAITTPPIAAPDEFKALSLTVGIAKAYQAYLNEKFAEWISRDKPLSVVFDSKPSWAV